MLQPQEKEVAMYIKVVGVMCGLVCANPTWSATTHCDTTFFHPKFS